ncbi:palmitoyltransferase akr1 [Xylographa trunciseda]|nr:palmitoyltransferase akr1 [Xylographa trunciseda]
MSTKTISTDAKHVTVSSDSHTISNMSAAAASPTVSTITEVEMDNMPGAEDKLPLHEDIMQLSRLGEIGPIKLLFTEGKYSPDYRDEEGITPLHWAAINNHYALCKFLIEAGASVDAKGGEAVATPAMWAAQRCNYYIVQLLLQFGADPLLTDAQGYNILHLATFDGNVFLLVLLLHQNIPIDGPDLQGHTCLMWAGYKGYPACVDLFLQWGASVNAVDENGFSALHWAIVKGSAACIQKLIEYGSDRFAETSDHKTPTTIAEEMKSVHIWERALDECGYNSDGSLRIWPVPYISFLKQPKFLNKFYFFYPFIVIPLLIYILSGMVIYAAMPIAFVFAYTFQWAAQKLLILAPPDMKHLHRTPYLAGVFAGTCFWVGVRWITKILPNTWRSRPFLNILFFVCYVTCSYFYMISMAEDPGYVPRSGSRGRQKATIDELLELWKFDEQNFCVHCMTRMPLRSKHCKRCKRCVAKHDHHCPWIHNCVGANNLRHFFLYILGMEVGILMFIRLVLSHLEESPAPSISQCNILAESICKIILRDTFTVVLTMWSSLQLTWVTMLLFVQLVQISRATTTYENMRGHGSQGSRAPEAITAALISGSTSMSGAQLNPPSSGSNGHDRRHHPKEGYFAQWKKLLGLDTFLATAQDGLEGSRRSRRRQNPFSRGIIINCKDFWCDPAPVFGKRDTGAALLDGRIVNYARMYETPARMKVRRPRDSDSEGGNYHSVDNDNNV